MHFERLPLPGAAVIALRPHSDARGFFARSFCSETFARAGLAMPVVQANISLSHRAGTLRGMHYQLPPHAEIKLVRCVRGAIFDVIVDLRPHSPTFLRWCGRRLDADNRLAMYVPEGFAHGFLTLCDDCEVHYQVSAAYAPAAERGLRHDDPRIAIDWPYPVREISDKDRGWPDFDPDWHGVESFRRLTLPESAR